MFGDKKEKSSSIQDSFSANTIQSGTSIKGDIESEGSIRIDGKLEGTLVTKGKLVIGSSGSIIGDIDCKNANIEGRIEGRINVNGILILKSTAKILGDINTAKLVVEEGAEFNGKVSMGNSLNKSSVTKNEKSELERQAV